MDLFQIIALLITLAALLSWLNDRLLGLPNAIGLMLLSLAGSLLLIGLGQVWPGVERFAAGVLAQIDFNEALMHGMLGFLLFAGALHVDLGELSKQKWTIGSLASIGVLLSTALVGLGSWGLLHLLGIGIDPIWCFLFGALIAPTDPIAVLGILKHVGAPKSLETKITGESLFNDGIGVVVFLGIFEIATGEHGFDLAHLAGLFVTEALGGALFGLAIGYLAYLMLRSLDNYAVEILISLALVFGGYALAMAWHLSGPIAMVVAGLLIGNHGRRLAMSEQTREHLDHFWELIDEVLNAVLFVLIGLEVLVLSFQGSYLLAGLLAIPLTLLARFIAVGTPISVLKLRRDFTPHAIPILTWGGLRGGISVALALSIPATLNSEPLAERQLILTMTYVVVIFSIIVQGLSLGKLVEKAVKKMPPAEIDS